MQVTREQIVRAGNRAVDAVSRLVANPKRLIMDPTHPGVDPLVLEPHAPDG